MSVDHETLTAFGTALDAKLQAQDDKRSAAFAAVHNKLDRLAETTAASFQSSAVKVAEVKTTLDQHMTSDDNRFAAIDKAGDRKDGWAKVLFAGLLGGLVSFIIKAFSEGKS